MGHEEEKSMLRYALTALLFLGGMFFVYYGAVFLLAPSTLAPDGFGLNPESAKGWATLRADMTAFFILGGGCMMLGAWRRSGDVLLVPALLFGIAFIGRAVGAVMDEAYEGFWTPMLAEGAVVIVSLLGHRLLPHHKVEEITS
jgi:hypothetical protein